MKLFSTFLCALLALSAVHAAPLTRDLGRGLAYHRVHELPADLPTDESTRKQPTVLDLRYVHGDATAAVVFSAWVAAHASLHAPIFILANADTSHALLAPLAQPNFDGNVLVIGAAAPGFVPDIAVKTPPDVERRAYDALEHTTTADSLVYENPDKPRNDEARLAKEHLADTTLSDEATPDNTPGVIAADKPAKPTAPAPLIDAALQRAVHLHRALVALKKI